MTQYIPKSAVLAEIRKYINNAEAYLKYHHNRNDKSVYAFEQEKLVMCELLSSLDNLEVKEVEEPNAADRDIVDEIIISLKQVENDYRINHTKEIEWLRNKVKKGD